MKRILILCLLFALISSLTACAAAPQENPGSVTQQEANTNFFSTAGTVLHHEGYTYFISGHTVLQSDGKGSDFYTAEYALLRIADDKSASAEVLHTFDMKEPRYLFFANGRIWFTVTTVDSQKGDMALSMGSILPNGSGYQAVPSDGTKASSYRILGVSNGKLYFQQRSMNTGTDTGTEYFCFNANTSQWEQLPTNSDQMITVLTVHNGYAYYGKYEQVGSGNQVVLWRAKIADSSQKELMARLSEEEAEDMEGYAFLVSDGYFFFESNDCIQAVSIETGDIKTAIEDVSSEGIFTCNATAEGLYYISEEGLYLYKPQENKTACMMQNTTDEAYTALAICGNWFVYATADTTSEFYRVNSAATQLPEAYYYRE